MTVNVLNDVMKKTLNDRLIFTQEFLIFDEKTWKLMNRNFDSGKFEEIINIVDQKIQELEKMLVNERQNKRQHIIEKALTLSKALKPAIKSKPFIISHMFVMLDNFGLIKSNLPNMEDYGKIIEKYTHTIVQQYFLSKIDRVNRYQKNALRKILEYINELYEKNIDTLEIAYFIRKLNSLPQFIELIKND